MFDSVLIANRGEIARRIIRACRALGLRTIAVHSDADRDAPFVREADQAVAIGPAPARASYLRVDAIIDAARRSGAGAIHPGYGFLSESPALARACEAAGIVFVGPTADMIEAMGSKIEAKRIAAAAGVPVIPGYDGDSGDDAALIAAATGVGFPLLVKASAGGGGKGMRAVTDPADLPAALVSARLEAKAAFGDDRLLLERLIARPRHVEVQIAADRFGDCVHLFERDCSVQRNNQKVFEEAPAPDLPEAVRAKLLADSIGLARAIGYTNLGTMEFLYDRDSGAHFFLEMNTRLQVEHPVTEMISGRDLVALQLRIAAGEPLGFAQDDVVARGHAIEARLTAERPDLDYRPATGRVAAWVEPPALAGVRFDSAVETGSDVSVHYDSLLAKIIAHGDSRAEALRRLRHALDALVVLGPATNRRWLLDASATGAFADGTATTATLRDRFPDGWRRDETRRGLVAGIAAAIALSDRLVARAAGGTPWHRLHGLRSVAGAGLVARSETVVEVEDEAIVAVVEVDRAAMRIVTIDDIFPIELTRRDGRTCFTVAGSRGVAMRDGDRIFLSIDGVADGSDHEVRIRPASRPGAADAGVGANGDLIVASMPGVVAEIKVAPGQRVTEGEHVLTLESMKLFVSLLAPRDGVVAAVRAAVGDTVAAGLILAELEGTQDAGTMV